MTTTPTDTATLPPLGHAEAMDLQRHELELAVTALSALTPDQWVAPTDCPDWDVRRMYLHVLGACEAGASMREQVHQLRAARRRHRRQGGPLEAALSAVQVEDRLDLAASAVVARLTQVAPRTVKGRRRLPGVARRHVKMQVDGPVVEKWSLGYLNDVIYLRDLWMHRVDLARATGTDLVLTADHDGRIVADVVAEWARRHGRPFVLELSGPAGSTFAGQGEGVPEHLTVDAVEFCRILAGRAAGDGLLGTIVPF